MNKKMRDLLTSIKSKTSEAAKIMGNPEKTAEDVSKAAALFDEVDALQKEFEVEKRLYEATKGENAPNEEQHKQMTAEEKKAVAVAGFCKAVRAIAKGVMTEGVNADGGYTVPEDISTEIRQYRDVDFSLLQLVRVEKVSTIKGSRTYQKLGDVAGFTKVAENGTISNDVGAPEFERISFTIEDYAGFMVITNQLLNDSDANLLNTIKEWFGKNSRATANALILAQINTKSQSKLDGIKGIKKTVNVTLGQTYKATSSIVTNDDGLDWLDQLVDGQGRPLLNPDPTAPANIQLRCGTTVVPVKVLPNKVLKTTGTKIPVIIGDLAEAITYFDRQQMEIMASNTAQIGTVNAFSGNLTVFRAIEREDVVGVDSDAYVNGYIDTTTAATA